MSYTVEFKGTRAQKIAAARKECKTYLGAKRYRTVVDAARSILLGAPRKSLGYRQLYFSLSFAGIQGKWPVRAVAEDAVR